MTNSSKRNAELLEALRVFPTPEPILHTPFALVALLAGSAAFAQPYIGASAGRSDFQADCAGAASCDTADAGYKRPSRRLPLASLRSASATR